MRSVLATLAFFLVVTSPASAATEFFVAESGSGSACSHAAPCKPNIASLNSADGDTITFVAGTHELTNRVILQHAVTLRGEPGTTLSGDGSVLDSAIEVFTAGATISDLQIKVRSPSGSNLVIRGIDSNVPVTIERVRVIAEQQGNGIPAGISVGDGALIRDTMVIGRGSNSIGVAAGASKILNVTIDSEHTGIGASPCFARADTTTAVVNSIVKGGNDAAGRDFEAFSGKCNSGDPAPVTATIAPNASNYRSAKLSGSVVPPPGAVNQIDNGPVLDSGLLQESGSPTIDAGVADPSLGATDFGGDARTQGTAVDIGADEFTPPPASPPTGGGGGGGGGQTPPTTTPPTAQSPPAADKTAPVLGALKAAKAKLTFSLTEAATVKIAVTRLVPGRKVGKKCKEKARRGKKCTIAKSAGTLTIAGKSGANSVALKPRGKKLPAGSYKLTITAVDAAGNKTKPRSLSLKIR